MRTELIFVILCCIRIKDEVLHEYNWFKPHTPHPCALPVFLVTVSHVVNLVQFVFMCAYLVSFVAFVLSIYILDLFFFWSLGSCVS